MKTLFLGSYGFGNLGDELCLIEAMQAFPSTEAWAFSVDPAFTAASVPGLAGFIRRRAEIQDLKPERVVLGGGGVGFYPSIKDSLHWMYDAYRLGAKCHVHNIGVAAMDDLSWIKVPEVQHVLKGCASFTVRDDMSWTAISAWPGAFGRNGITFYPEQYLPRDDSLLSLLPRGRKLLGVSMTGQQSMRLALKNNAERVFTTLASYVGHAIIPIISTVSLSDPEEDDVAGFEAFRALYLASRDILCPQFLDKTWWRENMTPQRLKGLIGGLDVLFTQRKHNLIHAIGTNTPAVGIFPAADDSIARIFFSLRAKIPPNSSLLGLP